MAWTAYVKFSDPSLKITDFVSKVRFGLHKDYQIPFKDTKTPVGNKFTYSNEGYTMFSMPVSLYFHKSTGLTVESFKLPEFEHHGVVKKPYVKINKIKYNKIIK
jgi:transcription initiation factor IIF auxiliary subunit